ncbi:MAG: fibrobacter succinogenes major paralogous domain-containing protein [Bacteroidales bacterium]|nr:fibrobacter succinogenes major paralogous domain-containing protein [Bacteroidales bacterium]
MRKLFILGAAIVVSVAMLLTSCKKEEVNDNGNNSNTENPGGGGSGSDDHVIPNAVSDIDGNCYDAVQIGNQVWMAENLRTTRYADGTTIPLGTEKSEITPYRYNPNNDANNVPTYGYLYNWPAVMHGDSSSSANPSGVQGICPNGWHVPSSAEWIQLTNYVGSQPQYQCNNNSINIAKALASTTGWSSSSETCTVGNNPSTNNATGFSALPAGTYGLGGYYDFGYYAYFWSATEIGDYAYYRFLRYYGADVYWSLNYKFNGFSVRCVRD